MINQHAPQNKEAVRDALVELDITNSPLIKLKEGVLLYADLLKKIDVAPQTGEQNLLDALRNSDFYTSVDTPKKLLLQSNPAALAHFIEISGGIDTQENRNLLESMQNFLGQAENREVAESEACQNSLIWLTNKFPETAGNFTRFLNAEESQELKKGHVQKLTQLFSEVINLDSQGEFQNLGCDAQLEAGKFFKFLHSREFRDQWELYSTGFQSSFNPNDPGAQPKIRRQGGVSVGFADLPFDVMKAIFSGAIEYRFDNSLLSKKEAAELLAKILTKANNENILPAGLVVPQERKPAATAAAATAEAAAAPSLGLKK